MNTFLARAGSNCRVDLAIKQSLPCGYVQLGGGGGACAVSTPHPTDNTYSYSQS